MGRDAIQPVERSPQSWAIHREHLPVAAPPSGAQASRGGARTSGSSACLFGCGGPPPIARDRRAAPAARVCSPTMKRRSPSCQSRSGLKRPDGRPPAYHLEEPDRRRRLTSTSEVAMCMRRLPFFRERPPEDLQGSPRSGLTEWPGRETVRAARYNCPRAQCMGWVAAWGCHRGEPAPQGGDLLAFRSCGRLDDLLPLEHDGLASASFLSLCMCIATSCPRMARAWARWCT